MKHCHQFSPKYEFLSFLSHRCLVSLPGSLCCRGNWTVSRLRSLTASPSAAQRKSALRLLQMVREFVKSENRFQKSTPLDVRHRRLRASKYQLVRPALFSRAVTRNLAATMLFLVTFCSRDLAAKFCSDTEAALSQAQWLSLITAASLLLVAVGPVVPQHCGIPGVPGIPGSHGQHGKDGIKGEEGDSGEPTSHQ